MIIFKGCEVKGQKTHLFGFICGTNDIEGSSWCQLVLNLGAHQEVNQVVHQYYYLENSHNTQNVL